MSRAVVAVTLFPLIGCRAARPRAAYPGFGWDRNAGYVTPEHGNAFASLDAPPHHRRSFAPIARLLEALRT